MSNTTKIRRKQIEIQADKKKLLDFFYENPYQGFTTHDIIYRVLQGMPYERALYVLRALQKEEEIYYSKDRKQADDGQFHRTWKLQITNPLFL